MSKEPKKRVSFFLLQMGKWHSEGNVSLRARRYCVAQSPHNAGPWTIPGSVLCPLGVHPVVALRALWGLRKMKGNKDPSIENSIFPASGKVPELKFSSVQFSHSVVSTLFDPMDCSTPGFPVHHQFPEFTQTHVHWVGDAIQPSHPLSSPCPPTFNLFQHQGLFQCVSSSNQVAKILEFQLQHQSFQWIFRTDFL